MSVFTVADAEVWPDRNMIVREGREVRIEPRVMDLLVYLAERPGEVVSGDRLISDVWPHVHVTDSALLTAVSSLRKAFGDTTRRRVVIETIPKRGYRLIAESTARRAGLAVLPLRHLSDAEDDFFADGLTELLTAELGRLPTLRVISARSAMTFKGTRLGIGEIAGSLGVSLIVDGTVTRTKDEVRVSIELINAAQEQRLLTESDQRPLGDVLRLQQQMAQSIARKISSKLAPEAESSDGPPVHTDALMAYLRGRFHFYRFSPEHFDKALAYFEEALRIQPTFAPAQAGVADVWGAYAYWGLRPPAEVRDHVYAAATRAEALDPASADAQMLLGAYHFHIARDWSKAAAHLSESIRLNPNLPNARILNGLFLATLNRPEAADEIELAVRLDPLNPGMLMVKAKWLVVMGDRKGAQAEIEHILGIDSAHPPTLEMLADLHWLSGDPAAIDLERRLWQGEEPVATVLEEARPGADARQALLVAADRLLALARTRYVSPRRIVRLLTLGGRIEDAISHLDDALANDNFLEIDELRLCPALEPLRSHPRFTALLARMDIPPYR